MPLPGHSLSLVPWPALLAFSTPPLPVELSMVLSDRFPESLRGVRLVQSCLLGHWLFPSPHCRNFLYPRAIASSSSPPRYTDSAHVHKDTTQQKDTTQRHTRSATSLASGKPPPDLQCQHFNYGSTPRDKGTRGRGKP